MINETSVMVRAKRLGLAVPSIHYGVRIERGQRIVESEESARQRALRKLLNTIRYRRRMKRINGHS